MKFRTQYNFGDFEEEKKLVDDSCIVETAGYQPKERLIQSLIMAGQRLQEVRLEEFDGSTVEEALEKADITRSSDFDIVDAYSMLDELSEQKKSGDSKNGTSDGVSMPVTEKGLDSIESEPTN